MHRGRVATSGDAFNAVTASRIAGLLYGNVLHRNADPEGYNHYYNVILNNEQALSELIYNFYTCDEFVSSFVVSETPNELARNLLSTFFDVELAEINWVAEPLELLVKHGLPAAIRFFLQTSAIQIVTGRKAFPATSPSTACHL